jgi:hypothetical protein
MFAFLALAVFSVGGTARAADRKVCVELVVQDPTAKAAGQGLQQAQVQGQGQGQGQGQEQAGAPGVALPADFPTTRANGVAVIDGKVVAAPARAPSPLDLAILSPVPRPFTGQTSPLYLKRLVEHFVTHAEGYVAVEAGCDDRMTIELYPLKVGWTAFARFSKNGREERVDQLLPTELTAFAERVVTALLRDVPISTTIDRGNVLASDSKEYTQRVRGTHHFLLGVGTQLRGGMFSTAQDDVNARTAEQFRLMSPMDLSLGYRGKFEAWGVEALANLAIGTSRKAAKYNLAGGHVDMGGSTGLQLHFLYYLDPRGLTSLYLGSGATFEVLWFSAIRDAAGDWDEDRETMVTGGLNVDALVGWEFLRASSVQFFLEAGLHLPVYAIINSNDAGSIRTWFPGLSVKIGVMF